MWQRTALILIVIVVLSTFFGPRPTDHPTAAQDSNAPCGVVEGFDFPVPDIDIEYPDFGIYRVRFGGLHTGIDVAFEQLGMPVRAAARGRVTYSDVEGWGTEKGVVVIQHTFPDGTLVNTLYGHMEQLNGYSFPYVDQCVDRGDVIGAIGSPSLGLPHLHYEIRTRYRYEGGPGYTEVNPLELGWLHPVDFTFLARIRVHPAYLGDFSLLESPTLPLLDMQDGSYIVTHNHHIEGVSTTGEVQWRFDTLGSVSGIVRLNDGRVLFTTSSNQVLVLNNGSYDALWDMPRPFRVGPALLGDLVVFVTEENTLVALTPDGAVVWESSALPADVLRWAVNGDRLAISTTNNELFVVAAAGTVLYHNVFAGPTVPAASPDGGFWLLSGTTVWHLDQEFAAVPRFETRDQLGATAEVLSAPSGMLYVYPGEGRSLYAYSPAGDLVWIAYMPGNHLRPPHFGLGGGQHIYVLTMDGQLLAYATSDGRLLGQLALYDGGIYGAASTRWLHVSSEDVVTFSSGFLSVVTLDGLAFANVAD
ncbi:MAG: peptidoglycan DD-metalloendopeptidase family protein [Chloroflexi bacterium]|nr:peptidoglycan DD-metalloendopeptidase family protein [Chloroflexota bacterium]